MLRVKKRSKALVEVRTLLTREEVAAMVQEALLSEVVGVDSETTGCNPSKESPVYKATAFSIQVSFGSVSYFIPTFNAEGVADFRSLIEELRPLICKASGNVVMHGAKYDMHVFENAGLRPHRRALLADTLAMSYTHNSSYERHGLKECVKRWFGDDTVEFKPTFKVPKLKKNGEPGKATRMPDLLEVITSKQKYLQAIFLERVLPFREKIAGARKAALRLWLACKGKISKLGAELIISYSALDPVYTARLYEVLKTKMQTKSWANGQNLFEYFNLVEVPYTTVLYRMERRGIPVSKENLLKAKDNAEREIATALKLFNRLAVKAGAPVDRMEKFNTKSGKDIAWLFTEVLGIKGRVKRRKNGSESESWDEATLKELALKSKKADPLVQALLTFRDAAKVLSTYILPFLRFHKEYKGRIHTTYKQAGTKCLPAGEMVLTSRGYLAVEDVRVSDCVLSHKGRSRRVLRTVENGVKPVYLVKLSNGLELRTTGNHKFYRGEGRWRRADKLRAGTSVCIHATSGKEVWKDVPGWPDWEVSSWGRVGNRKSLRIATQRPRGKWGHLKVTLRNKGAQKRGEDLKDRAVHTLVMDAFGPPKEEGRPEVRHKNGVAWDNSIHNLEWGSSRENRQDALKHGTMLKRGTKNAKLTEEDVARIRATPFTRGSDGRLATEFGVNRKLVSMVRRGQRWADFTPPPPVTWELVTVVSVMLDGEEKTYGLVVDEDHSHITGGIVTHNTGRLSSSTPNLQNLKREDEDSPPDAVGIRKCFVASERGKGRTLLGCIDQAQIEARLTAHFTQDPTFLAAIRNGWDLHSLTATKAFANVREFVGVQDITADLLNEVKANFKKERQMSKTINFAIIYGIGAKGLSEQLKCPEREAQEMIDGFFNGYPGVKRAMKKVQQFAAEKGYIRSMLRRYVYCKDAQSSVQGIRSRGLRQSFNFLVQGCMLPETLVLTSKGYVRADQLLPTKAALLQPSGKTTNNYTVHEVGTKNVVRVFTSGGSIEVSPDHRFMVGDGRSFEWKKLNQLSVGDWLLESNVLPKKCDKARVSVEQAELLGALVGDGSYCGKKGVTFAVGKNQKTYRARIAGFMRDFFGRVVSRRRHKDLPSGLHTYCWTLASHGSAIRQMRALDFQPLTAEFKRVPTWVFTQPDNIRGALLRGLFDTDGGVGSKVGFTSCGYHLVRDVHDLLSSLGISSRVVEHGDRAFRVFVALRDLEVFQAKVGFSHVGKSRLLQGLIDNKQAGGKRHVRSKIPEDVVREVGAVVRADSSWKNVRQHISHSEYVLWHRLVSGRGSLEACVAALRFCKDLPAKELLQTLLTTRWVRLERKANLPPQKMVDIEIFDKDHGFVAHGLVQHNSASDMVKLAMIKIENDMRLRKWDVQMCLQVHDELIFLCDKKYTKRASPIIEKYLSKPMEAWGFQSLSVETPADINWSKDWASAK